MAVIRGTQGGDFLRGILLGDSIFGFGGNDLIQADPTVFDFVGGNDVVDGGSGNDRIFTFGGKDTVDGGSGNERSRRRTATTGSRPGSATTMSKAAGAGIPYLGKPATMRFEAVKMTTTSTAGSGATRQLWPTTSWSVVAPVPLS